MNHGTAILKKMTNRSRTFHYHLIALISRAQEAGVPQSRIDKIVEIAERYGERRNKEREEQSSSRG